MTTLDDEEKLVGMILEANKNVRYACISDQNGNILWNSRRNNIESLVTLEDTKKALKMELKNWKNRNEFTGTLGEGLYSIEGFKKLKRITVPLQNNHLLYIHVEGKKPEYIGDILKIVDWVEKNPSH